MADVRNAHQGDDARSRRLQVRARPGGSCNFGTISARFYVGASYEEGSFCGAVHAPSILYPEY